MRRLSLLLIIAMATLGFVSAVSLGASKTHKRSQYLEAFLKQSEPTTSHTKEGIQADIEVFRVVWPQCNSDHDLETVENVLTLYSTNEQHTASVEWWTNNAFCITNTNPIFVRTDYDGTQTNFQNVAVPGQYLRIRVRTFWNGTSYGIASEYWNGSSWVQLGDPWYGMYCLASTGNGCRSEIETHVLDPDCSSAIPSLCPQLGGSLGYKGVDYTNVQLRTAPGVWSNWTGSATASWLAPYYYCDHLSYYSISFARDGCT